jgi:hypothetical protein
MAAGSGEGTGRGARLMTEPAIRLAELAAGYDSRLWRGVTLDTRPGEFIGVLGGNGAGNGHAATLDRIGHVDIPRPERGYPGQVVAAAVGRSDAVGASVARYTRALVLPVGRPGRQGPSGGYGRFRQSINGCSRSTRLAPRGGSAPSSVDSM